MQFKGQITAIATLVLAGVIPHCAIAQSKEISVQTPGGQHVRVSAVSDNIIKVSNWNAGETLPETATSVLKGQSGTSSVSTAPGICVMTTGGGIVVRVDSLTGSVDISAGPKRSVSDNGLRTLADGQRRLELSTVGGGSFYGAGERGYSFNLAGDTLVMYNKQNYGYTAGEERIRQMNITMPLFLSSNGYAVVFDDFAAASMIMSNPIVYTSESRSPVSYYFINGAGSLASVTQELSALTGRQKLPPFWALGYITSKYGYHTQQETLGVVDTLKRAGYPLDGIVLDLYWYGKEEDMGRLAWDQQQWPDHKKMLADLKARDVNTVIISQPYILRNGRGLENYNELASKGLLVKDSTGGPQEVKIWVGEGGMFDVSNPDTRSWLRERYKTLTLEGVGGWWGDLGEPEVHPETGIHANGLSAREYHNLYGNDWSSVISDLFASEFPDRRLMTMMRGGTTGLQRYSVYPWSTDVSRSWGGLQPQITIMLNSGLSGLGYMSHDVGGFAIDPEAPYDPELYVRWLQLGTFSPILRTHAQATAEPYNYPDQQHIILPLIKERYRWLPYNYTLAYENASQGLPLVRPLNFYSPGSDRFDDITDEYLWGRDILVAPVMTQGATRRTIVLPDGLWVDYNNPGRLYNGGDTVTYPAPLEVLPLFVRAGAIIPQADYGMQSTEDYRTDRYTINYYPYLGKSEYTLFEDDRKSPGSLDEGAYSLINFTGEASIEGINLDISSQGTYPGAPKVKDLTFRIHLVDGDPSSVSVDGHKLKRGAWKFDRSESMLTFKIKWNVDKPLAIHIR
ncbi:TIM-barrel domain-containing protein [Duncaniella muris]|uniref:TIM-barrel domain-containing protein n=3 Tax=Duncaniella muris TaxID=2094150 RepID=UPI0026DF53CA|nr:TIM-barrel domain-containing protein [Duncaniella muris]